jgi:hypothetical protein
VKYTLTEFVSGNTLYYLAGVDYLDTMTQVNGRCQIMRNKQEANTQFLL